MRRPTIAAAAAASLLAAGIAHAQSDAKHGQKMFEECHACHAAERGINGVGPSLYGIFGRRAGELDDFRYSPALKKRSEEHTSELQSLTNLVCRLLLEKKKIKVL